MSTPWMPLYVADYLADTSHLTTLEHGAYMLLIMHYWRVGCLPKDDRQLQRITRMSRREWSSHRSSILGFFDAEMQHQRVESELLKCKDKIAKRAIYGSMGGTSKALKTKDASLAKATVLLDENPSKSVANAYQPQPQPHIQIDSKKESSSSAVAADGVFAEFWMAYPRKVGKGAAERAWATARKLADPQSILAAVRSYGWPTDAQFIPHAATWLNQKRWTDEAPTRRMSLSEELALGAMEHLAEPDFQKILKG